MPISGGPPGLTFGFVTETETVPASSSLVLGDSKFLCAWEAEGALDLWREYGAGWSVVQTPAGDDIDAAGGAVGGFFIHIEAAKWRLENAIAADRHPDLSVINVG